MLKDHQQQGAINVTVRNIITSMRMVTDVDWTTLFFGPFPALFRQDFLTFVGFFVVTVVLALLTAGIGNVIAGIAWAFMYNRYYTRKLLERGYQLEGSGLMVSEAAAKLGVVAAS